MTDMNFKNQKGKILALNDNVAIIVLLTIFCSFSISCWHNYHDQYRLLQSSSEETRNARIRLYTINDTDTFFYDKRYAGHIFHDGELVFEKNKIIVWRKKVSGKKYHGLFTMYFDSGNIQTEGYFFEGVREGIYIHYVDSSLACIETIIFYKNGITKKIIDFSGKPCCIDTLNTN